MQPILSGSMLIVITDLLFALLTVILIGLPAIGLAVWLMTKQVNRAQGNLGVEE